MNGSYVDTVPAHMLLSIPLLPDTAHPLADSSSLGYHTLISFLWKEMPFFSRRPLILRLDSLDVMNSSYWISVFRLYVKDA